MSSHPWDHNRGDVYHFWAIVSEALQAVRPEVIVMRGTPQVLELFWRFDHFIIE